MKAVMITRDGYMKYMTVDKKSPYYRSFAFIHVNIYPLNDPRSNEPIPIIEYELEREYVNEFDETVLIYKEH